MYMVENRKRKLKKPELRILALTAERGAEF
jgi:hypothetical protein